MGGNAMNAIEREVLLSVKELGDGHANIRSIETRLAKRGHKIRVGWVFLALDRLNRLGYVSWWLNRPISSPQGHPKRVYVIERTGEAALQQAADLQKQARTLSPVIKALEIVPLVVLLLSRFVLHNERLTLAAGIVVAIHMGYGFARIQRQSSSNSEE